MIVEQGPDDRATVEALLTARIDQAMFPLTNFRSHGLTIGDFPGPHDHATRFWRTGDSLVAVAVLFAASDAAAKACRAIGFQPSEPFALFLLSTPRRIAPCP